MHTWNSGTISTVKLRKFPETGLPFSQGHSTAQWDINFSRKGWVITYPNLSPNQRASKYFKFIFNCFFSKNPQTLHNPHSGTLPQSGKSVWSWLCNSMLAWTCPWSRRNSGINQIILTETYHSGQILSFFPSFFLCLSFFLPSFLFLSFFLSFFLFTMVFHRKRKSFIMILSGTFLLSGS